ncbi:MAG: type VI secretion system baseplate subunit TssG [Deltaproteobacteria bacterium]|nr:type VI secretion system baseplate subunit TssG [Deltaproteobacteria bacterium]
MISLEEKLRRRGFAFEFFQAVRLLEKRFPGTPRVGENGPYSQEPVRLRPSRSLGFPPGDVRLIEQLSPAGRRQAQREVWRITQNFLGLYGVTSPLPAYFSEMIAQTYLEEDPLRDFLDIFNHRLISLYYRAWKKYRLSAAVDPTRPDKITQGLLALLGRQEGLPEEDWRVAPLRLVRYASLLAGRNRPPGGLEFFIGDFFGIDKVRVTTFVPRWVRVGAANQSRVGVNGRHHRLGESLVLGNWVRDVAGLFRLTLGPLSLPAFWSLLPGGQAFTELVFLVRLYTRQRVNFELELILKSEDVEPLRLSAASPEHPLGRYSWLGRPRGRTASTTITPD